MNLLRPELLDRLAREYALGTLHGGARRRFERVLQGSPAARMALGTWQERLGQLAASLPPLEPREQVWQGLEQRLFPAAAAPAAARRGGWLAALLSGRTLGGALAGVLLCVLLLRTQPGLIGMEPASDGLPASYVGLLTDASGKPTVLASSRRHGRTLTVKMLQPVAVPAGRVAQLWALPKEGAPFPVGVVPASGSARVTLADSSEKLFFTVPRLAVSFEPAPAAPGSAPSSEFVLTGNCVKLW
ncbi:MAG: anti-sigma factor [Piscinibacter sp.]|uniref:anti-sigma factor n=1 Tax=Piscinibacter TaxID=1114981 RepID=UPI000FDE6031|nr:MULTISPECIES: anti-sigma factor [Piscinibacter]MCW5664823.1 anti-sigma factor [Piscinibacter sp.]